MVPASANVRRHFLSWERPLLPQAVSWLVAGWEGGHPLDLSRTLVIVPTRQSGRRLREALAIFAATKNQAAFPPRVLTPDTLISLSLGSDVASRSDALLAWIEVFLTIELPAFREVFPIDPPARNFAWACGVAHSFIRLQATLAEGGLTFAEVPFNAGDTFVEAARWVQLGALERLYERHLAEHGLKAPQAARIEAARGSAALAGIERIVLCATPDPLPLALQYLSAQAASLPVEILVFAPAAEGIGFDDWGRPRSEYWSQREIELPDFKKRVHLCAHPAAQAEQVAVLAGAYPNPPDVLGVGVADPEVLPLLTTALRRREVPSFNPEGRSRRQESLFRLLKVLVDLVREPTFAVVQLLALCPDFLALLCARLGNKFSVAKWLAELDELRARHLPGDLAAARHHARDESVIAGLAIVEELRGQLLARDFATSAAAALRLLFADRRLDLAEGTDAQLVEAASAWNEVVRECAAAGAHFPRLTTAEWWEFALRLYAGGFATEEKPLRALELQGWLELLWEDAPHLAIAGMNDGRVPESVSGDAYLPEALRTRLGLKNNEARFARDGYILQAVVSCRPRTDCLFGKTSTAGEPLRPSRLLLRCRDEALPDQVAFLFRAAPLVQPNFPWRRAWKLQPRSVPPPQRIRVTALRDYLQCPFRFYLRHVLRMESVKPGKTELDAMDFGTLCHSALEQIGKQPALRDCTDPVWLREVLVNEFDRAVRGRFGTRLTLPLVVQGESARQRLAKAAEIQARERAAGWIIEAVETPFEIEIGGMIVRGKIDRIERHGETGARRVLDYKTSDKASTPAAAHFNRPRRGETPAEWARFEMDGRLRVWTDLQLPLYLHALSLKSNDVMTGGYFNLPKAAGETGIALWEDYSPGLKTAALRCAEGVCTAIRAGEFWPPNETLNPEYDEFAALFHHGVAASIAKVAE
ncbi:MAG: PD-(D/E)XK nuclease family protein [Opitutaceae bacterium]